MSDDSCSEIEAIMTSLDRDDDNVALPEKPDIDEEREEDSEEELDLD